MRRAVERVGWMGASLWHKDATLLQGLCPCDVSVLVDWEKGCRMPLPSPEMMQYVGVYILAGETSAPFIVRSVLVWNQ